MRVFYFTLSQILFSIEKKISFLFLFLFTFNLANSQIATWTSTCDGSTASSTASGFTSIPIDISHDCAVSCLSTTEGSLVGDQQNETTVNDQSFSFGITNNTTNPYTLNGLSYDVQRTSTGFNTWEIELFISGTSAGVIDPSETWTGTSQSSRIAPPFSVNLPAGSSATFLVTVSGSQGDLTLACNTAGNNGTFRFISPVINGVVLPVTFSNFSIQKLNYSCDISFSTASETNNDYFTIERSGDGRSFESIGEIKGAGNSNQELSYEFVDESPLAGINYYRIKQTDFDGAYSYTEIRSVRHQTKNVLVTPNKTDGKLNVTSELNNYDVVIYNTGGQEVQRQMSLSGDQSLSIETLQAGVYFVKVMDQTIRILKF